MLDAYRTSGSSPGQSENHIDPSTSSGSSPGPDFEVENHSSIFLLRPLSPAAFSWINEHIPEDAEWFGNAVAVEHRFIWGILEGLQNDGLTVVSQ